MKSRLVIFDVSALVNTGMSVDSYKNFRFQRFPTGGMRYFLKMLALELSKGSDVICAFDSRSFRKDIYSGYKAGRPIKPAIYAQCNVLYNFLLKSGIACYKVDTFEADDIIYNAVQQNKHNYLQVVVYGNDYDLCHNVDEGRVTFESVSSNTNSINASSFRFGVVKDKEIHFNTIAVYKVLRGDNSDCIPAFNSVKGYSGLDLYDTYVKFLNSQPVPLQSEHTKSVKIFRAFLEAMSSYLLPEDYEILERNIKLVFPAEIDQEFLPKGIKEINSNMFNEFLSMCDEWAALRSMRYSKIPLSDTLINTMVKLGKELETGEYAVDHNREVNVSTVASSVLFVNEF